MRVLLMRGVISLHVRAAVIFNGGKERWQSNGL
jgi:hypothetical protein